MAASERQGGVGWLVHFNGISWSWLWWCGAELEGAAVLTYVQQRGSRDFTGPT
jgi:hypothetical protein